MCPERRVQLQAANVADVPVDRVRHKGMLGDVELKSELFAAVISGVFLFGRAVRENLMSM